jgi:AcrR family transcriptional regulator
MKAAMNSPNVVSSPPNKRRYGGVLPEDRQRQRRAKLIDAALQVFGTKGFHGATVREVCVAAQLTERYFYESFEGMPALFMSLYQHLSEQLMNRTLVAVQVNSEATVIERMEAALRVFFVFIQEDPRRGQVMLADVFGIDQAVVQLGDKTIRDYAGLLRLELGRWLQSNPLELLNLDLLADGLIGLNVSLTARWMQSGFKASLDEVVYTNLLPYQGLFCLLDKSGKVSAAA